jgi:RNA polymerase sigma-70 factor, ECF subfamily
VSQNSLLNGLIDNSTHPILKVFSMTEFDAEQFETHRPFMLSIAYRMLGSRTEAEDIVQKAYLRYQATNRDEIVSPKAFLSTMITRLCLNHLDLAREKRETYIGTWLPEPTVTDERLIPSEQTELHESLSMAFLMLLEHLTPLERAVFLLHEVFDYSYGEIGAMVDKEEDACRQILSRAKKHMIANRPRFKPTPEAHRQILDQFLQTVEQGELDGLLNLLSEDVTLWADANGRRRGAIINPLHSREKVARFLLGWRQRAPEKSSQSIIEINGAPSLVVYDEAEIHIVLSLTIDAGQITAIHVVGNPDKLKWITQPPTQEHE